MEYELKSAKAVIEELRADIRNNATEAPTSTDFKALNNMFDGGLYQGLYVIGAMTSMGTTSLLKQITDQIAQQGKDVLFFSLEMSRTDLMSKSISREACIFDDEASLDKGIERYGAYAKHVSIVEGIDGLTVEDISRIAKRHAQATGSAPIVVVDYLQLIAPSVTYTDPQTADKQNMDRAALRLKHLSHDLNTAVFAISSINRHSYKAPVSMSSFKESGGIESLADVLIGLDFKTMLKNRNRVDIEHEKQKSPRNITLTILKNKLGETGCIVDYRYYPAYNLFEEVGKFNPMPSAESEFKDKIVSKW
ncbi:DnaB-like helicase C-terminal domain-containing protein [Staphylococcus xylosus]|uniref:DnaB-like helicase C-terminal domain-containing protein n=1 Tax=Staphylococcus xylosus TaxID=1288 RepID=UPI002DBD68B6|nr:DnaB-like helicase C-terminal domain-containing protein [Staphylococcus xylosus]MEB7811100.1 DnaB helicase C-terminal domain-containing protein [Staphylococcus xylosus]